MENVDIVISLVQQENGIGVSTLIPLHLTAVQVIAILDQVKAGIQAQLYNHKPEITTVTIEHLQKVGNIKNILTAKNKIFH